MGYIERKFSGHQSMQCHTEEHDDGTLVLVSYTTEVCKAILSGAVDADGDKEYIIYPIGKYSDPYNDERIYSPTTARHLSMFFAKYFKDVTYPQYKKAALDDKVFITGILKRGAILA